MICVIDCGTSWLEDIKQNLFACNQSCEVFELNKVKEISFKEFSAVVISGAPTILTKENLQHYMDLFSFVKQVDIPVLGICLGHQLIGLLHGSSITQKEHIDRMETIDVTRENVLFEDIQLLSFREDHSEHISLPEEFVLLAKSDSCENEAMKHPEKSIFSVQFHPEVSGESGKLLFRNFLSLIE